MNLRTTLPAEEIERISAALGEVNQEFGRHYPGETDRRQAVHTVYGGGHLFRADSARRLGAVASRSLEESAPDPATLGRALRLDAEQALLEKIYGRIVDKLRSEPVEDFRLDFEDG